MFTVRPRPDAGSAPKRRCDALNVSTATGVASGRIVGRPDRTAGHGRDPEALHEVARDDERLCAPVFAGHRDGDVPPAEEEEVREEASIRSRTCA